MSKPATNTTSAAHHRDPLRRLVPAAALVLALIALALSAWAVFRPSADSSSPPSYTDAQRTEAKEKICAASELVRRGIAVNTNLQPAGGPSDVTGSLAVAANARLALYDGGQYLSARLDPATPPELADSIHKFADTLTDIGAAATAGEQNSQPAQAARLREVDSLNATITDLCK